MPDRPLQGVGVLVTRPRTQATELVDAIEAQGGMAYCFPVIEIAAFDELATASRGWASPTLSCSSVATLSSMASALPMTRRSP
jgi:uroporphyrinogen-III synthase